MSILLFSVVLTLRNQRIDDHGDHADKPARHEWFNDLKNSLANDRLGKYLLRDEWRDWDARQP